MRWIIKAALVIGIPVVAVLAVAAILLATVDPNDYKERLAKAAEDATGRNVEIAGDITTTFFPVLGFEVAGISIGNPAGYEDDTFLTVSKAQAGVELMPLLQRKINISKIILTKPAINVIRQRDGSTNLAFDMRQDTQEQRGAAPEEERRAAASDISIGQIEINDARVTYNDMATGEIMIIDPLNMTLPGFKPGEETDIALDMVLKTSAPPLTVEMNGSAKAKATPELGAFEIGKLQAEISARSPTFETPLNASITGGGSVNAKEQQFALNLDSVKANWQDTSLSGNGAASGSFDQPRISFAAEAPSLNTDTLRATLGNRQAPETSENGENVKAQDRGANGKLIPVELVRGLALDGKIKVGKLTVSELTLNDISADIDASGGILNVAPIKAVFYEGQIDSALSIDASGASPTFSLTGAATNVEVAGLLQDKLGQDYLTGRADMNFDLTSRGNTMQAVNSAAGGIIGFNFGEGYINKWELSRRLNQAIAFFETGRLTEVGLDDRVHFTSLDATFNGQDGVFRNDDLLLVGPKLHTFGAGAISMASQTVDYTLRAGLGEEADESARHVPVRISGPFSDLNYGLDLQAAMNELAGEKIEEKKDELIGKALEKLGTQGSERIEPSAGDESSDSNDSPASQLMKGLLGK